MKESFNCVPRRVWLGVVAIAMVPLPMPAIAQSDAIFEEIVVRAQRRDQNIMEVPVAVTAVTGAEIQESGIRDVFELQQNVPGLIVGQSQTTTTSNFSIRGIGSTSNNFGVESSVGLYVDEVYRPRQSSIVNELVDVEAVEVLRGPQGTLFGKNTAAGAIQIRTVAPSPDSADAFLELQGGDFGLLKLSGASNLRLSDTLALRGTAFLNTRDGYVDDDNFGSDFHNDRDRFGVRLQLGYQPSDDFNMRVIADYSEIEEVCCVAVARVDGLYSRATIGNPLTAQPGSDAALAQLGGRIFTDFGYPDVLLAPFGPAVVTGVGFDEFRVAYNDRPLSTNEDSGLSVEFNKTFGNGMTLTSITALRMFDTTDFIDGDFTNVDIFTRSNVASQESLSQEFRLSGDFGNGGNYVAGIYYFGQEIESLTNTGAGTAFNTYVTATDPDLAALIAGVDQVVALSGGLLPPRSDPFSAASFAQNDFKQDQDGWAAFGQIDFPLGDNFLATFGLRYTDETKKVTGRFTDSSTGPPPDLAAIQAALIAASQGQPFDPNVLLPVLEPNQSWGNYLLVELAPRPDIDDELNDDQTTGTAKLTWFATETSMFYASYSTGFKSGGTNTDRIATVFSPIFGAESSESVELGFKGDIGPVRLAAALYQTTFDDFQANTFTGTGFNLQNAGEVEIRGFEIEGLWRPTDTTEIQGFYAHNEGEYNSFIFGTCWDTYTFHTGIQDPGTGQGATPEQCDKTGEQLPYNPEDRAFLAITQNFPFGDTNFFVRAEASYYSDQLTDGDLDPFTEQEAVTLINLRAGFDIDRWNSTVTVWGRNITDERFYTGSFDAPISLGRMNSYPSEPLSWGVTLRANFD